VRLNIKIIRLNYFLNTRNLFFDGMEISKHFIFAINLFNICDNLYLLKAIYDAFIYTIFYLYFYIHIYMEHIKKKFNSFVQIIFFFLLLFFCEEGRAIFWGSIE